MSQSGAKYVVELPTAEAYPPWRPNKEKNEGWPVRLRQIQDVVGPEDEDPFVLSEKEIKNETELHETFESAGGMLLIKMQQEEREAKKAPKKTGTASRWRLASTNMASGVNVRGVGVLIVLDPDLELARHKWTCSEFPPPYSSSQDVSGKRPAAKEAKAKSAGKAPPVKKRKGNETKQEVERSRQAKDHSDSESEDTRDMETTIQEEAVVATSTKPRGSREKRKEALRTEMKPTGGPDKAWLAALTRQSADDIQKQARYETSPALQEEVKRLQAASASLTTQLQEQAQRHAEEKAQLAAQHEERMRQEKAEAKERIQEHLVREEKMLGVQAQLAQDYFAQTEANRAQLSVMNDKHLSHVVALQAEHKTQQLDTVNALKSTFLEQFAMFRQNHSEELAYTRNLSTQLIQGILTQRTGQLLDNSPVPSTVADSVPTTPIGPPFLDIAENNQSAEEALQIVQDMASVDREKSVPAMVSLAKYRGLAADGAQPIGRESIYAKAVVKMIDDLLLSRK
ncbi:hypothetical protein CYMTET_56829 [Cymbomonas tetramitiformis]|uniref:Uncharacterized protein n=1 Tax=Cymbomonas tetramitiformis TaxID=36881 RepID=A0AAE0BBB9_9CHLO|nr:hypothetical protein CYMTET_56829 [Cymbomonas tetramitiformis]